MRERAFAVLGERVVGARFLDLYAGTGAVGFEALSRGAAETVFVERHRSAVAIINANRSILCDDGTPSRVIQRSADRAVAELARRAESFDVVWADPPFESWRDGLSPLLRAFELGVIRSGGLGCFECPSDADVAARLPQGLSVERDLTGGASRVLILAESTG
jgi:16S rRNA (guanine(966)-N(2))-methyltransferase RsmD